MVEFWPEARRASANRVLATADAEGGRQQPVGVLDLGHLGLARACGTPRPRAIRIAALTKKARPSAKVLSIVAKRIASRLAARVGAQARVCTMAECR